MARDSRVVERLRGGVRKPEGGYRFVSVVELGLVWWAYLEGFIRFIDLRVYFACHELLARRGTLARGRKKRFSHEEIQALCGRSGGVQGGAPPERVQAALTRLEAAGLVSWSEDELVLARTPEDLRHADLADLREFLSQLPNNRRLVPIPRRTLRLVASGCGRAKTATILGHLMRCVYSSRSRTTGETRITASGTCKASWVAETFGVSLRAVKSARQDLVRIDWLSLGSPAQWYLNRFGLRAEVNLEWSHRSLDRVLDEPTAQPGSAPPEPCFAPGSAPPESNKNLLTEYRNQKPAGAESGQPEACQVAPEASRSAKPEESGFWGEEGEGQGTKVAPPKKAGEQAQKTPTLKNIVPADLRDTGRLLVLFSEATRGGLTSESERDRLEFVGLAEHARAVGREPCRLFATLVRKKLFAFITQDDEESARKRLNAHLFAPGGSEGRPRAAPAPKPPERVVVRAGAQAPRVLPARPKPPERAPELREDLAAALERIRALAHTRERGAA